jgi:hypothetical protein
MSFESIRILDCRTFLELARLAQRLRREREKDSWLQAAFIGWQVVAALGGRVSFRDYVKRLGLKELLDG